MAEALFRTPLEVHRLGAVAELLPAPALVNLGYRFVVVKDGGDEAIVLIDAPAARLHALERDRHLVRLTPSAAGELRSSYPVPKLKQRLRSAPATAAGEGTDAAGPVFETVQTVRAGFHLIDVPVVA